MVHQDAQLFRPDFVEALSFAKVQDEYLPTLGILLKQEPSLQAGYGDLIRKLAPCLKECNSLKSLPPDTAPGTDLLLINFTDAYKNVPEVCNSIAVCV